MLTAAVGSEVTVRDATSIYDGRHGVALSLDYFDGDEFQSPGKKPEVVVSLMPPGYKPGDTFDQTKEQVTFGLKSLKVTGGGGNNTSPDNGNTTADMRTPGGITAGSRRYTPSPRERVASPGTSYNGVEAKATAAVDNVDPPMGD